MKVTGRNACPIGRMVAEFASHALILLVALVDVRCAATAQDIGKGGPRIQDQVGHPHECTFNMECGPGFQCVDRTCVTASTSRDTGPKAAAWLPAACWLVAEDRIIDACSPFSGQCLTQQQAYELCRRGQKNACRAYDLLAEDAENVPDSTPCNDADGEVPGPR